MLFSSSCLALHSKTMQTPQAVLPQAIPFPQTRCATMVSADLRWNRRLLATGASALVQCSPAEGSKTSSWSSPCKKTTTASGQEQPTQQAEVSLSKRFLSCTKSNPVAKEASSTPARALDNESGVKHPERRKHERWKILWLSLMSWVCSLPAPGEDARQTTGSGKV